MTTNQVAQLKRKILRLEAQLAACEALNMRISNSDFSMIMENANMREILRQIAEMAAA